jgi:NAD(P)-dependent dehydrogenase (short-subunit alcohol dehydrogenase family)
MTSAAEIRRVLDVNLVAPFLTSQAFGTHMLAAGSGSIVNIASIAGLVGVADRAAYNASKHGLIGLTAYPLPRWWGHRGVRTNAVCHRLGEDRDGRHRSGCRLLLRRPDITSRIPMGRFAFPDDVAEGRGVSGGP